MGARFYSTCILLAVCVIVWSGLQLAPALRIHHHSNELAAAPTATPSCPLGLPTLDVSANNHLEAIEGYGTDAQRLKDISAVTERNEAPLLPDTVIPKVILQTAAKDGVPIGMQRAIRSIIQANPGFEHRFFSDRTAGEWMAMHADPSTLAAYRRIAHEAVRLQLFVWCYLLRHGGVYVASHYSATHNHVDLYPLLSGNTSLIVSSNKGGRVSVDFMAASANHTVLQVLVQRANDTLSRHSWLDWQGPELYTEFPEVAGHLLLTSTILDSVNAERQAAHRREKTSSKEEGPGNRVPPLKNLTALAPGCYEWLGGLTLLGRVHNGHCELGYVHLVCNVAKEMFNQRIVLYNGYHGFARDQLWYKLGFDDAATMFEKRTLFTDESVLRCNVSSSLFLSGRYLTRHENQVPLLQRFLLPIASHHPPLRNGLRVAAGDVQKRRPKIPLIIMQTNKGDEVPKDIRRVMQWMMVENPEFEHYYFSDVRIRQFIQQHFDARVLKAFDDVIPGAFKSDLFRYCFLYIRGGVYMDTDFMPETPLLELLTPELEFLSAEDCGSGGLHNGFMASVPGHPLLKAAIDQAVNNIEARYYGRSELEITGPTMLRTVWKALIGAPAVGGSSFANGTIRLIDFKCGTPDLRCGNTVESDGMVYLRGPFPTYMSEMRWYGSANFHYYDRWLRGDVFVDNNDLWDRKVEERIEKELQDYQDAFGAPFTPKPPKAGTPAPNYPHELRLLSRAKHIQEVKTRLALPKSDTAKRVEDVEQRHD